MKKYYLYFRIVIKAIISNIILHTVKCSLISKDIWLFEEKPLEARDNAFYLYKYVKENHPEICSYYVIRKGSPDIEKIKHYGTTINTGSLKHYIYWMAAKYSINSQQFGAAPYPTDVHYKLKRMCRKGQKTIFLQHGIIKDDMIGLHYERTRFDLFVCSAPREYEQIKDVFGYPPNKVKLLGMCRYDALKKNKEKTRNILVMPTYRVWMRPHKTYAEATQEEANKFRTSMFYNKYKDLLSNETIINFLEFHNYKLVFYLHYSFQPYTRCFKELENSTIIIADRSHYDVQKLLINSDLLITDFSSVYFDYAYMEKPVVYYQFDEEEYRKKQYSNGYFSYSSDGFGPVYHKENELVAYIIDRINNNCELEAKYLERVNKFFEIRDYKNCERNFNAIIDLG